MTQDLWRIIWHEYNDDSTPEPDLWTMQLTPGTPVRILITPIADAAGRTGTVTGLHKGGYAVKLDGMERTVWCDRHEVEPVVSAHLHVTV